MPPIIKGEPSSEPPDLNPIESWLNPTASWWLNPTASWYLGYMRLRFEEIARRCGPKTATWIFQKCIRDAEEQQNEAAARTREKAAQRGRELPKWPTAEQIAAANRKQISIWWARLPNRKFNAREKRLSDLLLQRLIEVRGYAEDFKPKQLPPIKKPGSISRNAPSRKLPALFGPTIRKARSRLRRQTEAESLPRPSLPKLSFRFTGTMLRMSSPS